MSSSNKFSDAQIAWVLEAKEKKGLGWSEITSGFNKKFGTDKTYGSLETCYRRYKELFSEDKNYIEVLKKSERQRRANGINSKENKILIDSMIKREDILEEIRGAIKSINKVKTPKAPRRDGKKHNMTMELLISDVHFGKLTDTFNHEVMERRLSQIAEVTLKEIRRNQAHYNVERIIIAYVGDIIENSHMHSIESRKGCEFGDSKQIAEAIRLLFSKIIVPLHQTGIKIDCVGVTGNHDRIGENKTYHVPGEENTTWVIYHSLKMLCETANMKSVSWEIPTSSNTLISVYGEKILYEHGDAVKGGDLRKGFETLLAKRIKQLNTPIHFVRSGHFHSPCEFGIGQIIVNGSVPGDDSYALELGFSCPPSQTLNSYIERTKSNDMRRQTSFFKRLLIQLN